MFFDERLPQQLCQERLQEAEEERQYRALRRSRQAAKAQHAAGWIPAWFRVLSRRAAASAPWQG